MMHVYEAPCYDLCR